MLQLSPDHVQHIQNHAASVYPEECCGLLLGQLSNESGSTTAAVVNVWQTPNAWSPDAESEISERIDLPADEGLTKTRRYWIDPKDMLEAQRYARDRDLTIIGIYHSHTDHPAIPSECDRALAWSDYSYLIVSVHQGIAQDLLSWKLDKQHQFQPEAIHIYSSPAAIVSDI